MPEIKLQQKQKAIQSAQQILSSQLLQLPLFNLEQRIYDELQENPMLELASESKDTAGDISSNEDTSPDDDLSDSLDRFTKRSLQEPFQAASSRAEPDGRLNFTHESAQQERFFQAVQHDSFDEVLLRQLVMQEDIGEREVKIAIEILGNLDPDGYFTDGIGVILDGLQRSGIDAEEFEVEKILQRIPYLDPPGIAVRDLRERLLLQLRLRERENNSDAFGTARLILEHYYDDFLHKRYDRLLKKFNGNKAETENALTLITALDPHPVDIFHDEGGHYIMPDFIVTYENGDLTAMLNDRSSLSVKVSERYKGILKNRKAPKDEKQFIRYNLIRANDFAAAIAIRRQTLLKVIESLMKAQYAFFVSGPEHLVPLGMKAIAEDAGLDISTISRAVNGKYVQTRFGVFELKYFFSSSLSTDEGDDMSSKIIRQYIVEMVKAEDPLHPLSDDVLTDRLKEKGINIARRTVAKYREQMQIPVARLRKKIF
ncbi:MAG: RNA polymerase factor sigma-54 [Chlorobium sp.]|jgi:RNA polymerase sigma-54 factor|uniref:RNA polymerase factor sigma-54 n=1 Tax=Chlorobium sp. TaxID=1095 RepID=UPI001DEE9AEF|nr:RNA polymerase factor sigma-54 [Chlorobium sp.]MBN1279094.1 RNA polymerase factor sigma-54 [Chlorobiaceae bacterium]MCF8215823.1 RNA polymerase factor sigma-54 [Chlorobium sp.]MCF8270721.1 RNA polymerase factor sigma-54 [Chlorobium sp.]MCF8287033.1 RNA polymerase factor sigma-54 [Chlorobium sp.]MCF8290690.1 RNA polymerase factor sigma-54 [Chlorobium sp.]